jgi:hypothetical protein
MKSIIIVIFALLMFSACSSENVTEAVNIGDGQVKLNGWTLKTYVIDSCEYVGFVAVGDGSFLTHKGNCRFCAERQRKFLQEQQAIVKKLNEGITANEDILKKLKEKYMW